MNWPTHFVVCGGYDVVDSGITTHGRGGGGGGHYTRGHSPFQFVHHVHSKYATPILHVIDKLKNYETFSTYT